MWIGGEGCRWGGCASRGCLLSRLATVPHTKTEGMARLICSRPAATAAHATHRLPGTADTPTAPRPAGHRSPPPPTPRPSARCCGWGSHPRRRSASRAAPPTTACPQLPPTARRPDPQRRRATATPRRSGPAAALARWPAGTAAAQSGSLPPGQAVVWGVGGGGGVGGVGDRPGRAARDHPHPIPPPHPHYPSRWTGGCGTGRRPHARSPPRLPCAGRREWDWVGGVPGGAALQGDRGHVAVWRWRIGGRGQPGALARALLRARAGEPAPRALPVGW